MDFLGKVSRVFLYASLEKGAPLLLERTMMHDTTAEDILARFSDYEKCPNEALAPYQEFLVEGKIYYFTPGGFLYRKDSGTEEIGGFFCGYLSDEVWHYRTDDS